MKVFTNIYLPQRKLAWKFRSNRSAKELFLWNHTGRGGALFEGVGLGFHRKGREYHINLNIPSKRPSPKTVGIFLSNSGDFESWEKKTEIFSGKSIGGLVTGYFGIYKIGSFVKESGLFYELTDIGWQLKDKISQVKEVF